MCEARRTHRDGFNFGHTSGMVPANSLTAHFTGTAGYKKMCSCKVVQSTRQWTLYPQQVLLNNYFKPILYRKHRHRTAGGRPGTEVAKKYGTINTTLFTLGVKEFLIKGSDVDKVSCPPECNDGTSDTITASTLHVFRIFPSTSFHWCTPIY